MRITCDNCDKTYVVPDTLVGDERRLMRCGDCGARWWHGNDASIGGTVGAARASMHGDTVTIEKPPVEVEVGETVGSDISPTTSGAGPNAEEALCERGDTAMIVLRDDSESHAGPDQGMHSFFDGISSRFAPQQDNLTSFASQRFQKLKSNRQRRIDRGQESGVVDVEFREIRDYGEVISNLRFWLVRGGVLALIVGSMAFALIFA